MLVELQMGALCRTWKNSTMLCLTLDISVISTNFKLAGIRAKRTQCNREYRAENQKQMGINHRRSLDCPAPAQLTFEVRSRHPTAARFIEGLDQSHQNLFRLQDPVLAI